MKTEGRLAVAAGLLAAALMGLGGGAWAGEEEAAPARGAFPSWFEFGGDLRVRHDSLMGKVPTYTQFLGTFTGAAPNTQARGSRTVHNDSLLTNRLGLNFHIKAAESVTLTTRLLMYKAFGMADAGATQGGYFGDRTNTVFDGSVGHVPAGNTLVVDQAYATVNNLFDQPVWFSAGRRPSSGGIPVNIRDNRELSGASGTPALLVDYAFDGMTLGVAPDYEALPGLSGKLCYGRGYDSGYLATGVTPRDTDMLGLGLVVYETPDARIEAQYDRGFNIFDTFPGPNVRTNLGSLEWWGGNLVGTLRELGPGDLTGFLSGATSVALPNGNRYNAGFGTGNPGLLCDGSDCVARQGYALYLGGRYDLARTKTKLGAEFNHGTKNWVAFGPAADDMWTNKLGTRGNVYELYAIQELPRLKAAPKGQVFFKLGWQYYDFDYTGSNGWVGEPKKIASLTPAQMQFQAPVSSAYDIYTTFEVRF